MVRSSFWTQRRFSGIVLILGSLLFLTGAFMPVTDSKGAFIYQLPPDGWLRVVYDHPVLWTWTNVLFISGTLLTVLALGWLTTLLRDMGNRMISQSALLATFAGALLLVIHMAFRIGADFPVAQEMVKTGHIPSYYLPILHWVTVLFLLYSMLMICGMIAYGAALLLTRLLPRWLGWTIIVYNLAVFILLGFTGDMPPFAHYLLPIVMGVLLLLPRYQEKATSQQHIKEAVYDTISSESIPHA